MEIAHHDITPTISWTRPIECCQAVGLALKAIQKECQDLAITLDAVGVLKPTQAKA
jgi:hypothetical protein